ncbi:MAG: hypothetical protein U0359_37075 [Byssovorax sp.]
MRFRWAAAVFAGLLALPVEARAQAWTTLPTVNLLAGYTLAQVYGPYPAEDAYSLSGPQLTPSASLLTTYETALTKTRFNAQTSTVVPFDNGMHFVAKRFNYHLQLNATTTADLDPRTTLKSVINGGVTPVNILAGVVVDASQAPLDVAPTGVTYLVNGAVEEAVNHQIDRKTSIGGTVVLRYNLPYNPERLPPSSLIIKPSLEGSRVFDDNTVTLSPGTQVIRFGAGLVNRNIVDTHYQVVNNLKASFTRPLIRAIRGTLTAGVNQTVAIGTTGGSSWSGMGGIKLDFDAQLAKILVSYNHDASVNGLTGQLNVNDMATLSVAAPLGVSARLASLNISYNHTTPITTDGFLIANISDHLTLRGSIPIGMTGVTPALSAAYAYVRPAGISSVFGAGFRTWTGDGSAAYTNERLPQVSFNLRGQVAWKQPLDDPTNATFRYTVTFGIGYAWPGQDAHAAAFQMRVAPAYTPTPTLSSEANSAAGESPGDFVDPRELTRPGAPDDAPEIEPAPATP